MIEPIPYSEIPLIRDERRLSPLREFADRTIAEFAESEGEAAIVMGAPEGYRVNQIVNQLRNSVWRHDLSRKVKVMQRKERVYLARVHTESRRGV